MEPVKCSVLICVYRGDAPDAVAASLESLLTQTRPPDEIVLVEDGPLSPRLADVIGAAAQSFGDAFRIHRLARNSGLIAALNEGLALCRGELLFRMDADDVAHQDRFALQIAFMDRHPEVGVVGTAMQEFIDNPDQPVRIKPVKQDHEQIRRQLVWRNPMNHPTICVRRSLLPASGYPRLRYLEDYFLWTMLIAQGVRFHNLPEALLFYRFDDNTLQRRSGWLNFRNEVYLRWWMYREGLAGLAALTASVLVQAILRFAPRALQRRIWMSARQPLRD